MICGAHGGAGGGGAGAGGAGAGGAGAGGGGAGGRPPKKLVARVPRAKAEDAKMLRLDYPPFDVLLVFDEGRFYAIEDACNHAGASLEPGYVENACIVCPVHGYKFSLETGALLAPKGLCDAQRTFKVEALPDEIVVWDTFSLEIIR